MKNKMAIPIAIAVGALIPTGYIIMNGLGGDANPEQGMQQQGKFTVDVLKLKNERVQIKTQLEGRVTAFEDAEIRPQIGGIIKEKLFKDGQLVKSGDVLYKIDDKEYKAELNIAMAALNHTETDLKLAKQKYDRFSNLIKNKAISQQDYDDANANYEKLKSLLEQRKADYELAKIRLEYTDVKSPIDGYVDISKVTKGQLVTVNQASPLTSITNISNVYIDMTQNYDDYIKDVTKPVISTRQAYKFVDIIVNGKSIENQAMLVSQGRVIDKNTGSIKLRAMTGNEDSMLLDGQYVRAEIIHGYDPIGIIVPQSSVQKSVIGNNTTAGKVKIVVDGIVKTKDIVIDREVSNEKGNFYLVADGLKVDDLVIVSGGFKVKDGDEVNTEIKNGENDG